MKYLFLYAIACFFLCTACFEKEEEIKVEEEIEVAPPKVDILKCEKIKAFITRDPAGVPKEPRATLKKYLKGDQLIFETNRGGNPDNGDLVVIAYWNTDCDLLCNIVKGGGTIVGLPCSQSFLDSLVYVETMWKDE